MNTCDIHTCTGTRDYKVGKQDLTRIVCPRCMEQLINGFGWRILGGVLDRGQRGQPQRLIVTKEPGTP